MYLITYTFNLKIGEYEGSPEAITVGKPEPEEKLENHSGTFKSKSKKMPFLVSRLSRKYPKIDPKNIRELHFTYSIIR